MAATTGTSTAVAVDSRSRCSRPPRRSSVNRAPTPQRGVGDEVVELDSAIGHVDDRLKLDQFPRSVADPRALQQSNRAPPRGRLVCLGLGSSGLTGQGLLGGGLEHAVEIPDDTEVDQLEDRGLSVLVDRDDGLGSLHTSAVLDRP